MYKVCDVVIFCITYVVNSKIISIKKLPPVGIEPGTSCDTAYLIEPNWQLVIEGYCIDFAYVGAPTDLCML